MCRQAEILMDGLQDSPSLQSSFSYKYSEVFVKEKALYQLQPVIKLLSKGLVKESALYQLQPVIKLFFKVC